MLWLRHAEELTQSNADVEELVIEWLELEVYVECLPFYPEEYRCKLLMQSLLYHAPPIVIKLNRYEIGECVHDVEFGGEYVRENCELERVTC